MYLNSYAKCLLHVVVRQAGPERAMVRQAGVRRDHVTVPIYPRIAAGEAR
jgi:hypothetical protein